MKNLIDLYPLIEEGFRNETDQHAIKLVLIAEEISQLDQRFVSHHAIEILRKEMTIRFGIMIAAAVGILATLVKLL